MLFIIVDSRGELGHSSFTFEYKVVADRVLGLRRSNGSILEDPVEIRVMFGLHFQNLFLLTLCRIRLWLPGTPTIKWSHIKSPLETVTDYTII